MFFFNSAVAFPEKEDELSPLAGEFGIEKDNKKYFPLKPIKVTDPNSPYKWLYEFTYELNDGYTREGQAYSAGKKEKEIAVVQIWKTF